MAARGLISKEGTLLAPAGQRAKRTPCSLLVAAPRCPLHSWEKWDIPPIYPPYTVPRRGEAEGNSRFQRTIYLYYSCVNFIYPAQAGEGDSSFQIPHSIPHFNY